MFNQENYQTEESCLALVKKSGHYLRRVKQEHRTYAVCYAAVQNYPNAIRYVDVQSEELCILAVKGDGNSIRYIENPTHEVYLEAVKQNGCALRWILDNQTPAICEAAVKQNPLAKDYVWDEAEDGQLMKELQRISME